MVYFTRTTFKQEAMFGNTIFKQWTNFRYTTFTQWAEFSNATFAEHAIFSQAKFEDFADFSANTAIGNKRDDINTSREFEGEVYFDGTSFVGLTTFEGREFKASTSFTNAIFKQAPNMHGTKLYSNTDFTGIECGTAEPNVSHGYYRLLKEMMEETGGRRTASIFYAAEQHCLLNTRDLGEVEIVISWFYKSVSEYGSNIYRPVGLLFIFQAVLFPPLFFNHTFPYLSDAPFSAVSLFFTYLALIGFMILGIIAILAIRRSRTKSGAILDILETVMIPFMFAVATISLSTAESLNWNDYWANSIMLFTNLFRPFYEWNKPTTPGIHFLIGLLHLTLMYSAFALLLFAIRRRFKME